MNSNGLQPDQPKWRQILYLGERIMREDLPVAQHAMIIETIEQLFGCQADLWIRPEVYMNRDFHEVPPDPNPPSQLVQDACEARKVMQEEFKHMPSGPQRKRSKKQPLAKGTVLAAPILFDQALIGAFSLKRPNGPAFSQQEIDFLDDISRQCAFALQASNRIWVDRHRLEMLSLVRSVSAQITDVMDLDELARHVTGLILLTFKYYFVAICTVEASQEQLRFRGSAGPLFPQQGEGVWGGEEPDDIEKRIPLLISVQLGEGIIGTVAQTGSEIIANDVSHNQFYRVMDALPETQAEVALPLKIGMRVLGVLDVQSNQLNTFDDTDMLVLRALADHIATAVENARLYSDVHKRAEQLSSISQVSNAIISILNLDDLLNEVARLLHKQMGYPHVHVFMVQPMRKQVSYQAGNELRLLNMQGETLSFDLDNKDQLIPWVVQKGETVIISETSNREFYRPWNEYSPHIRSEIAVPLTFGDEVLGVLDLQSDLPSAFGEDDRFLLETFAANVAIAMRNANLYRSEQWRRQVSDSMREVAVLLTADADLNQVLDLILSELHRALPCDYAAIWLLQEENKDPTESYPELYLAAVRLSEDLAVQNSESWQDKTKEILQACSAPTADQSWLLQGLQTDLPLIHTPVMPADPLSTCLGFPSNHSAITAPLRVADQPFGLLLLGHHTQNRYGSESQMMTATFASYAAVAIENTRLYEAAHDQAWVSTVLLEVAEATQSLATLEELLATMVRITPMLIGLSSCGIFLWDDLEESFLPATAHGLDDAKMQIFSQWRIALGDKLAFDQLFFSRQVVFISQENLAESSVLRLLYSQPDTQELQSVAIVPMIAHGEIMGAMLVAYQLSQGNIINGNKHTINLEDRFAIVQGIAQQTAVAVENIQLLKAQKEEAYVSVALLQVAQAIVSLNALAEILEAIVRLMPILVGVKRCAIFLWDSANESFKISQTYGISKTEINELQPSYRPEDFPFLEAVRLRNGLAYHAFNEDSEPPISWPGLTDLDYALVSLERSSENEGIEAVENKDHLKLQNNLLFAYPLAVKGIVLGVMLTQEMENAGIPSVHIREKRQEITTGITQQAAMAIQNDLLQCEVLERERLEREMQLARDIQQTFLPEVLPQPPGWDLDIRWKPAREVGGDFYDAIELANNHLGIVIADVADKGMPAALYMTLIRTLIRATAREMLSPAAVLKRVNDLLVSESKHGMFVTVAYAVISLDTGKVAYANAGHNYPLLYSYTGRVERLPTTGMALGVVEEITIGELNYQLEPHDLLVFYTDGVTEAFSTEGEMFGEGKLREVIQENKDAQACDLLQAIEDSISEYTEGAPISDDVTLVAIRYIPPSQIL